LLSTMLLAIPILSTAQYYDGLEDPKLITLGDTSYPGLKAGVRGGTFSIASACEPRVWNPLADDGAENTFYTSQIFRGLLARHPMTGALIPELAVWYEISEDNLTITFHLREGVKWSDGTPFTARDVLFTYNDLLLHKALSDSWYLPTLPDGTHPVMTSVDAYTVKVELTQVFRPALASLAFPILPGHRFAGWVHKLDEEGAAGKHDTAWHVAKADLRDICGLGPYLPIEYEAGQYVTMTRNPYYYVFDQEGTQLPYCDRYNILIEPDTNAARLKFRNGELHVLSPRFEDLAHLFSDANAGVKEDQFTVYIGDINDGAWGTEFIAFNQDVAAASMASSLEGALKEDTAAERRNACPHYLPAHRPATVPNRLLGCWDNISFSPKPEKAYREPLARDLQELFRDLRFRQAVAHALDKQTIIDNVYSGGGVPIWSPISASSPFYAGRDHHGGPITESEAVFYDYDPDLARMLLDDIGLIDTDGDGYREFSDGSTMAFEIITGANHASSTALRTGSCLVLQGDLEAIGIRVAFRVVAFAELEARILSGDYQAAIVGLTGGFDPHQGSRTYGTDGTLHFWHYSAAESPYAYEERIDELLDLGVDTWNLDEAFDYYADYQQLFASQDLGLIFTVKQRFAYAYYNNVGNAAVASALASPSGGNGLAWDLVWLKDL